MRKLFLISTIFLCCFAFCGCGEKTFAYSSLSRDFYNTGGLLTFVYDEYTKTAFFGGEGEIVQFYNADIAKGWEDAGCRIGVKISIPNSLKEYKSATAKVNDEEYTYSGFIFEDEPNYAVFQPIVSDEINQITIKIKWTENSKEQIYSLIVKEGTIFMPKS